MNREKKTTSEPRSGSSAVRHFLTSAFSWMLLISVVAGACALVIIPKASDARPLTVLSGSMVPTYNVGDVVISREVDPATLQIGDVITFQAESDRPELITHRIIAVTFGSDGREFRTQGDANDSVDPNPVVPAQIRGAVWYSVPLVGYVSVWLAGDWMSSVLDLAAIALLLYGGSVILSATFARRKNSSGATEGVDPVGEAVGTDIRVAEGVA